MHAFVIERTPCAAADGVCRRRRLFGWVVLLRLSGRGRRGRRGLCVAFVMCPACGALRVRRRFLGMFTSVLCWTLRYAMFSSAVLFSVVRLCWGRCGSGRCAAIRWCCFVCRKCGERCDAADEDECAEAFDSGMDVHIDVVCLFWGNGYARYFALAVFSSCFFLW